MGHRDSRWIVDYACLRVFKLSYNTLMGIESLVTMAGTTKQINVVLS